MKKRHKKKLLKKRYDILLKLLDLETKIPGVFEDFQLGKYGTEILK